MFSDKIKLKNLVMQFYGLIISLYNIQNYNL